MKIRSVSIENAGALAYFYNRQIEVIPYCYPVSEDEFLNGLVYEAGERGRLREERVLIAESAGRVVGFSHVAILEVMRNEQEKRFGLIRFFIFESGNQAAGQMLIEASEDYFRSFEMPHVFVYKGGLAYPFYHVGRAFLTDRWGHVFGLFGVNGYDVVHGQVFMDWRNFEAKEPVAPSDDIQVSLSQKHHENSERPGLLIEIFKGETCVGQCDSSPLGKYQRASEAQDQFYVGWLGVNESMQRKGWGRYMMDRMHWEMKQLGFLHATIGTELDNYRAMCLYLNDGYRLLFTEYRFGKTLVK